MTDTSLALWFHPATETVPDGADPAVWADRCVVHQYHRPVPRYLELHHVIPRAWQAVWRPPGSSASLWAPRTVALCRTGHGNVHYWIERMMKSYRSSITQARADALSGQLGAGRSELALALEALTGYQAAGGSLADLSARGVYGGLYGGNAE